MRFANPAGLALLALAVPVLVLHVLRPRRTPVTVSSILLWRRVERPVSAAQPWQRLRASWLLLVQLLGVLGLSLAVARPERLTTTPLADHTVFIVDASGSMAATDGSPDRLGDARARLQELRDQLPDGGTASVVVAGDVPRVALTASADRADFDRALRTIDLTEGRPDFADTFSLAQSLQTGDRRIGYVLVTDGGLAPEDALRVPPGTRVERVGSGTENRAIARLGAEPRDGGLHVRVAVRNLGRETAAQGVRIDVDGVTVARDTVELTGGASRDLEFDVPAGDLVEAFLDGDDLLAADDHAVAVASRRAELSVLVVGDPLFWQEALSALPGVTVETADPATDLSTAGYQLVVFNGVDVPATVDAPFVAVAPPGGLSVTEGTAVSVTGATERPAVTLVRTADPLLAGLDLTGVAIAESQRVTTDADVLVAGEGAPLLLRGTRAGQPFVYLTFALRDSNLPVQLAFPLLVDRAVSTLTGTTDAENSLVVGDRLPVPASGGRVIGPDAQVRTLAAGDPAPRASRGGFWRIEADGGTARTVAVNPPNFESAITPGEVATPAAAGAEPTTPARQSSSLLRWVLLPLLAIVVAEWLLARRRVGVGRRQWTGAVALRVIIAGLLVLALVDPTWRRASDRVATIFVVDGSASVGGAGDELVAGFLRDALGARPDDARAGIVAFGGDAHVDQIVGPIDTYGGAATVVDTSSTDLAAGLRLGAALAPSDARRRIVVLSDGRINRGDTTDELDVLAAAGIPVDVVSLPSGGETDVAVAALDVPRTAHPDERLTIVATLDATVDGSATVVLRRDGVEVARQTVELVAGANTVRFEDIAPSDPGAVLRYQVAVDSPGDLVSDNDVGYGAIPVEGPLKVLVVEGSNGEATTLTAALEAGGVGVDVIGLADLPGPQDLLAYAGIVLADVDARHLTGTQVETLTTVVRDLGRGLVTIGGTQSYGVGGYRQSALSELLPLDSEILDPERRRTVAEVLSIDTSESMGACHCDGPTMSGNSMEGGINKTDISRAAAERTISALAANDEVGVLAWSSNPSWIIPLQQLPSAEVVDEGLRSLQPAGGTDILDSLTAAAEALQASDAELKHIILFSDGFTDVNMIERTADQAGQLYEDFGITTSVLATGEGAAPSLEDIAVQGQGRFYAGTDLESVPQIMAEEAVIASRNFINEGEFLPEVTSSSPVVDALTAAPPLFGYVATSAKSQATTLLRIGPDRDPLLATWQAGLGRVTSWTSDVNDWSAAWSNWDGFVAFWSGVVKDTLPAGENAGALQATVRDGQLRLAVESADAFPDGATAEARVAGPDGQIITVPLERTASGRFEGTAEAPRSGSYAVGANVVDAEGGTVLNSSTLATSGYPVEFLPGATDDAFLQRLATTTGGAFGIAPRDVWDPDGLPAGIRATRLLPWLLLAAALLWPVAIALSRVRLRRAMVTEAGASLTRAASGARERIGAALPSFEGDPDNTVTVRRPRRSPFRPATDNTDDTAEKPRTTSPADAADVAAPTPEPPAARAPTTAAPKPPPPAAPAAPAPPTAAPQPTATSSASTLEDLLARKRDRRRDAD